MKTTERKDTKQKTEKKLEYRKTKKLVKQSNRKVTESTTRQTKVKMKTHVFGHRSCWQFQKCFFFVIFLVLPSYWNTVSWYRSKWCFGSYYVLVGLPGFARDFYCQLCLFVSISSLYLSVSTFYLSISSKPNLTLSMPACWPATPLLSLSLSLRPLSLSPSLSFSTPPSLNPSLSQPLPLSPFPSFQIRNSLLLKLFFGWRNSFII